MIIYVKLTNIGRILTSNRKTIPREVIIVRQTHNYNYTRRDYTSAVCCKLEKGKKFGLGGGIGRRVMCSAVSLPTVQNNNVERRAGSSPALGTKNFLLFF